tara:strand:+ start:248 stop:1225 length:978 start_codon:yes stop_codon:yes gene_type:complete
MYNALKIQPPKKSAFQIGTSPEFIQLHTLAVLSGRRGGGKSCAVANICRMCMERGYYDRVFLVTPTYKSNQVLWDTVPIKSSDALEPTKSCLKEILSRIETEKQEYDQYLERASKYKEFQKLLTVETMGMSSKVAKQVLAYDKMGFFEKSPPEWRYDPSRPPRLALILDDCLGSPVFLPSAGLTSFCVSHRHHSGIGCSVFMLVQSYCAKESINRAIRENTCILMLFKCVQEAQLQKIYEECDIPISYSDFIKMATDVFKTPFNFLTIDFQAKDKSMLFRRNFNEFLPYKEQSLVAKKSMSLDKKDDQNRQIENHNASSSRERNR